MQTQQAQNSLENKNKNTHIPDSHKAMHFNHKNIKRTKEKGMDDIQMIKQERDELYQARTL